MPWLALPRTPLTSAVNPLISSAPHFEGFWFAQLVGDRDWDDDDRVGDAGNSALLLQSRCVIACVMLKCCMYSCCCCCSSANAQKRLLVLSRLVGGDGDIDSELLPGWEPEAKRADGERLVPVLGLSSPAREPLRAPPPPAELPPVVLSTSHRTAAPDAPVAVPERIEPRPPVLLRESSSGRWRDGPEWRQQTADAGDHDRPDRNGFDRAADWDRRGDRPPFGRGDHGRYAQHGSRSALAGPPYNDLRMELVDPTLFPPLPPGRSPRHAPQQPSDEPSVERASGEAEPPADDRNEFEKELEAVVAELQRVRRFFR